MNIVFIGMSGSGKSTIGKKLSEDLGRNFVDIDNEIEKSTNLKITEIFSLKGEQYFREMENKIIDSVSNVNNSIIATGGGAILNKKNIDSLKINGKLIYLEGEVETLVKNLGKSKVERPLLQENMIQNINRIYELRRDLYNKYSDVTINVDNKSINDILNEIKLLSIINETDIMCEG